MQAQASTTSPHLLLVDDDRLILSTLSLGLQKHGYRVSTADSAEDAEAFLLGGTRPDLALLDVRMTGNDGIQLARRMHELDHIPFMMLTAYGDPAIVDEVSQLGALGYLMKPLDIPQLLPAIEAALSRANELQELRIARERLQASVDSDRTVSIAIGITMVQHRLTRSDAFELLRKAARSRRSRLADLAAEIIQACESLSLAGQK